jgi:predicted Zn-dependent peptidase
MTVSRFRLDNGLRIVAVPQPHLHVCEMACYVGVGGRYEPAALAGISHFLEHMLFRGTRDYPDSLTLERAFEAIGGTVNAATDAESTCYFSRLHPDQLATGAELFASLLRRPIWPDIETERRIIVEEALEDLNEHGAMINPDVLTGRLHWPDHPLSQPIIGTDESLKAIGLDALIAFHQHYYTPGNTVIVVSGRIDVEATHRLVSAVFSDWQGASPSPPIAAPPPTADNQPQSVWVNDSSSQIAVQISLQLPGRHDPDAFAMRIWRRLLSWGATSRLMLRLREELGLTYHVEANLVLLADTGCLTVDLSVNPDNLYLAIYEVLDILKNMRRTPVPKEELQRVVSNFCFDLEFSRDHADEMTVRHGWGELVNYHRSIEDDLQSVAALTSEQLQNAARRLIIPTQLALAIVGPFTPEDRSKTAKLLSELSW